MEYEYLEIRAGKGNDKAFCCKLEVGTKVEVRENILNELKNNCYIQKNFKLNIKRLNRWWYSVYFDKICSHDFEKVVAGESIFCSECGVKL